MNTPLTWQLTVTSHDPARAALLKNTFGENIAPIQSLNTFTICVPGIPDPVPCYLIDLAALTSEQFDRLCDHIVKETGKTLESVLDHLAFYGLAIPADTCQINQATDEYRWWLADNEDELEEYA